jgi:outer membrane protein TolC
MLYFYVFSTGIEVNKMKQFQKRVLSAVFGLLCTSLVQAGELSLQEAEKIALGQDALVSGLQSSALALSEQAIADNTLPDPKVKVALMNFPTDTFKRDQEAMTQVQFGIQQMIPRGNTLAIKSRRSSIMSQGVRSRATDRELQVLRDVRKNWLEIFYWSQAGTIVKESRSVFNQLVSITRSHYSTGKRTQQDVIRAVLELGLLDDRMVNIRSREEQARAMLMKWVGETKSGLPLSTAFPDLPVPAGKTELLASIDQHPKLQLRDSIVSAREAGVDLARQAYKPSLMVDVTYGMRDGNNMDGSERADFASAMLMFDVPLFTSKRQDRRLAASQHELAATVYERDDVRSTLVSKLKQTNADWSRLQERVKNYEELLIPQARANASAALKSYQSDQGDFTGLMRARITELETRLNELRVKVNYAKAQSELLYLAGEVK